MVKVKILIVLGFLKILQYLITDVIFRISAAKGNRIDPSRKIVALDAKTITLMSSCKPRFMNVLKAGMRIDLRIEATDGKMLGFLSLPV